MTRRWAPAIEAVQDAIAAAITTEQGIQAGSLPSPLHAGDFEVVGSVNRTGSMLPVGIRILPPVNSTVDPEVTNGMEAVLRFPCVIRVKALVDEDVMNLLREAVGLFIDAVAKDPTFGGLTGGTNPPGIALGVLDVDGGEASQELLLSLNVRLEA